MPLRTVWKYPLKLKDSQEISIVSGAELIHVDLDPQLGATPDGSMQLWALVDLDKATTERRVIRIAGTGHPIDEVVKHIGSVRTPPFIWHVFEVIV